MEKVKKIADFIQGYWLIITLLWAGGSTVVYNIHTNIVMPEIDKHIEERAENVLRHWLSDSGKAYVDTILKGQPAGFRGELSRKTGISKDSVVEVVAEIINQEGVIHERVDSISGMIDYQIGYNKLVLRQIARSVDTLGVILWKTRSGDLYFRDGKYLWKAVYYGDERAFFYFPSYEGGKRIKCE